MPRPRISASLAGAPLANLGQTLADLQAAGIDMLHFDLEDGVFVPVMGLGTKVMADLRPLTTLPFDVHLMMVNPEWILEDLARWGADRIAVHYEACAYPRRVLRQIAALGVQGGLAFNPATPLPDLRYLQPHLSFVVILTTEPEIPDSPFLPAVLDKMRAAKEVSGLQGVEWVVDGAVSPATLPQVVHAGADTVVVGRALFAGGAIGQNLAALRAAVA